MILLNKPLFIALHYLIISIGETRALFYLAYFHQPREPLHRIFMAVNLK